MIWKIFRREEPIDVYKRQQLYQMDAQQNGMGMQQAQAAPVQGQAPKMQAPVLGWTCSCGAADNRGKFCSECGAPKPSDAGWTCSCGAVNQGKFCSECGAKKPDGAPIYKCDKCGWEPEDPAHPPLSLIHILPVEL